MSLQIQIITPQKKVFEDVVDMAVIPSTDGELTILSHHIPLFTPLQEGVIELKSSASENYFSVGGGYMKTDGEIVTILVSRAVGQDEIDEKEVAEAQDRAKKMVSEAKTDDERQEAISSLRRSIVDDKMLKKLKHKRNFN